MPDHDAQLAEIRERIIANRKRDHAQSIAMAILAETGTVTGEQVAERLAREWADPPEQEIRDLIARKFATSIDHNEAQAQTAETDLARLYDKVDHFDAIAASVRADLDVAVAADAAGQLRADADAARALLDAAVAAGGDPGRAQQGPGAPVSVEVAGAAGEALGQ